VPCCLVRTLRLPLRERGGHCPRLRRREGREGSRAAMWQTTLRVGTVRVHGSATSTVESDGNPAAMIPKEFPL